MAASYFHDHNHARVNHIVKWHSWPNLLVLSSAVLIPGLDVMHVERHLILQFTPELGELLEELRGGGDTSERQHTFHRATIDEFILD